MAKSILDQFAPEAEKKAIDVSKKYKIGVIGTGWIAGAHMEALLQCPDVEIVALADLIPGKAERFAARYGLANVHFYPSHKELIDCEELDGVHVCTYNTTHAECAGYALDHGVNVLLEKPMTVTLDEAVELCKKEKASGKILSIGFQPRMDRNMQKIVDIVQSGELGKVYYIQTGGGRRRGIPGSTFIEQKTAGIGAMGDIGCYSLDMVLRAVGYPKPKTVTGYKSAYFGTNPKYNGGDAERFDVEDFAAAFVRLEDDIVLDFRISWAMHLNTPGDTVILGTEGALRIPSTECWNGSVGGPMTLYKDVAGSRVEMKIPLCGDVEGGLFYQKVRSFIDAIKYNRPAPVPTSEIIINQAIIDGIVKSAELGREIEIDIPEI
jgi:predicted dehydrogenase